MWHDARLVAAKDLRIELRSRVALNQVVPFALVVLLLFGLALGPAEAPLRQAAAGLFWVATLLATVLAVQRAFAIESAERAGDGLRLLGLDPAGIFLGKAAAVFVELVLLECLLGIGTAILFHVRVASGPLLLGTCLLASIALASVGTLYGAVTAGSHGRETLLPLLFLPVVAPVLLAATKAWNAGLASAPGSGTLWLELLAGVAVLYTALGTVAFGPLLEER